MYKSKGKIDLIWYEIQVYGWGESFDWHELDGMGVY